MLLFLDSFDHWSDANDKYTGGAYNSLATPQPGRHGMGVAAQGELIALTPASNRCIIGAAWFPKFHAETFFGVGDQNSGVLSIGHSADGSIWVDMFGADGEGTGSVVARSAVDLIKQTQWYFIELDVTLVATVLPNGTSTYLASVCKVSVDGALVIDATSLGPTSAYTGAPSAQSWSYVTQGMNGGVAIIDDLYVCDGSGPAPWNAPLGDIQIDVIRPNGPGAASEWAAIGAAPNWETVNDPTPDDDTTYVRAAAAGLSDLYAMEDVNTNDGIIGAQLLVSSRRTEEGFAQLAPLLRHAGVTTALPPRAISPTYFYRNRDCFVTMPNGDPLTDANMNALQAGMRRVL